MHPPERVDTASPVFVLERAVGVFSTFLLNHLHMKQEPCVMMRLFFVGDIEELSPIMFFEFIG